MIQLLYCSKGVTRVCKGRCEGTAALHGGGGLCWMEHCYQAAAWILSVEVDFGENPVSGIWPNSLPVLCWIVMQGDEAGLQSLN